MASYLDQQSSWQRIKVPEVFVSSSASPDSRSSASCSDDTSVTDHDEFGETNTGRPDQNADRDLLEPIAIIGIGMKFPGEAVTTDSFWEMLCEKRCASSEFPKDRLNIDAFHSTDSRKMNKIVTRKAHFIEEDIRAFDAQFFNTPPIEASAMDPQQRSLLETTYQALENAGISMSEIAGTDTSVHVGCFTTDFTVNQWRDTDQIPKYSATGAAASILSNKLSWFYDLHGVSLTLDTACSSGLVAVDLACNGLWRGKSKMAVVAAANLVLSPELNIVLSNMDFLSKDGRCFSFDHRANGYARGEGFATLILKPVSQAIKDGDNIRALIRSVDTNSDGHTSGGITQPSRDLQARLIRQTYRKGGLDMKTTRFFEAHGTGTPVGDPLEAGAIGECFRNLRSESEPLYVGAVKSNIGHLEGASGLAGIIKAVIALEKGVIPPNTNFESLNPAVDAEFFNLKFPSECIPWPSQGIRRASINSFGYGGTNAHVVLDDAYSYLRARKLNGNHSTVAFPPSSLSLIGGRKESVSLISATPVATDSITPKVLILSAADENGVSRLAKVYEKFFSQNPGLINSDYLADLAHTLNTRRSLLAWKSYAIIDSVPSLLNLGQTLSKPHKSISGERNLGFVFTGQGAQWHAMGRELLVCPVFKESLLRAQNFLFDLGCAWSLLDELAQSAETSLINDPDHSQPICTAVQIAIVDLLDSIGIVPSVVVGHSSGEIAAAYCAGHLTQRAALAVAYHRGMLVSKMLRTTEQTHTMASIGLSESQTQAELLELAQSTKGDFDASRVTVSCLNSPTNVTVSGPVNLVDMLVGHLHTREIFARKLLVGVGYHSPQMEEIAEEYQRELGTLERGPLRPRVQMISSVLCRTVSADSTCQGEYWVQNMVSPVNFLGAMKLANFRTSKDVIVKKLDRSHLQEVITHGWIEIGPHATLKGPLRDILKHLRRSNEVVYTSALVRGKSALETFLEAAGFLRCQNFQLSMSKLNCLGLTGDSPPRVLSSLPRYPFNHSVLHWEESPKNQGFRFRTHAPHPLLGSQVVDWNPLEAKWSFIIKGSELPWIQDHKINGSLLYPAAGMLVMAIEAVKLMVRDQQPIGYEIREASFHTPLIVSMSEAVETQITLQPLNNSSRSHTAYNFKLHARKSDDTWDEICRCEVRADFTKIVSEVDKGKEAESEIERLRGLHQHIETTSSQTLDEGKLYHSLKNEIGMEYGSTFQALKDIRYNDNYEARATLIPFTWAEEKGNEAVLANSQVIHPTSLDSLFHLAFVALSNGTHRPSRTMVPTRIGKLWVSSLGAGNCSASVDRLVVHTEPLSKRTASSSLSLMSQVDQLPRVQVDELEMTAVAGSFEQDDLSSGPKPICHHMHYDVDLDLLTQDQVMGFCEEARQPEVEPEEWYRNLETLTLSFAAQALREIEASGREPIPEHQKYAAELRRQLDLDLAAKPAEERQSRQNRLLNAAELTALIPDMVLNKRGQLYTKVGQHLTSILLGEVDPLQLLFSDPALMTDFYEEMNTASQSFDIAARYIDAMVHKHPSMKFLEIGAGTGATTTTILKVLEKRGNTPRYEEYMFTDISPSFFDQAQTKFGNQDRIKYRVLDIERDPLSQNFEANTYDVVIASIVLHATEDLDQTLANARKLLKPGGKLIIMELTVVDANRIGFVFGLLPGWWLSTDFRKDSARGPCISEAQWDTILMRNGFSNSSLVFRDWNSDDCHTSSVMISTAMDPSEQIPTMQLVNMRREAEKADQRQNIGVSDMTDTPKTVLVFDRTSEFQSSLATELCQRLQSQCEAVSEVSLLEINSSVEIEKSNYIVLHELERPILRDIALGTFETVQRLLMSANSVIWATKGGGLRPDNADHGIIQGLCRVSRQENHKVGLVTMALEETSRARHASHIAKVFEVTASRLESDDYEPEYLELGGQLHVNRIVNAGELNEHIFERTVQPVSIREFGSGPPLKLNIRTPGLLDSLEFVEDEAYYMPMKPHEVEVEVHAVGVNFKECLTALGRVDSDALGSECAGIVSRVGSDSTGFQIGDRVAVHALNSYKRFTRSRCDQMVKIPDSLSFLEASGIPTAFCTAYFSLVEVARMRKGETILIHAAAGGTGQAAIQMAQWIGAEIYATVGSKGKKDLLMERYGIREDHIFYSRDTSFAQGLKRMTNNRGVDVILNSLSGDALVASWECIAPYGRFIEIGRKDIDSRGSLPMYPFIRNAMFTGVDYAAIVQEDGPLGNIILTNVMSLVAQGHLRPAYPLNVYPLAEIEHAFRFLQSGQSSGKIVLDVTKDAMVPVVLPSRSDFALDANATYVIAGGLGGIGRSISRWLVQRGARNLLLLSRSGPSKNERAKQMIAELSEQGARIECPVCDISDLASLSQALQPFEKSMPPIKGCIQASMVLRDATFARMSYNDWKESTLPKIQGSWNLHEVLPEGMNFFVFLSSACGVFGNGGQSNYAAGNTYQDALAEYRRSLGEHATALDLGIMTGEGFVAENTQIMDHLRRLGIVIPISQEELFSMLDYYCNPARQPAEIFQSQVVTGIELPANIIARGQDVPLALRRPIFRYMYQLDGIKQSVQPGSEQTLDRRAAFVDAANVADAGQIVAESLRDKLSRVMGVAAADIALENRIDSLGVDSLVAVELRNWLAKEWSADIAVFEILGDATPMSVGANIARKSTFKQARWVEQ